jgi:hypothetical protein
MLRRHRLLFRFLALSFVIAVALSASAVCRAKIPIDTVPIGNPGSAPYGDDPSDESYTLCSRMGEVAPELSTAGLAVVACGLMACLKTRFARHFAARNRLPRSVALLICLLCAIAWPERALALVVYDNGPPGFFNGVASDFNFPLQIADDFSLGTAIKINEAQWWGEYGDADGQSSLPVNEAFSFRIFSGVPSGVPAAQILIEPHLQFVERLDSGKFSQDGLRVYSYRAQFDAASLPAGNYYFSIVNNTSPSTLHWYWEELRNPGDKEWNRQLDGAPWSLRRDFEGVTLKLSFVPEPASSSLATLSLLTFGASIIWRRTAPGATARLPNSAICRDSFATIRALLTS